MTPQTQLENSAPPPPVTSDDQFSSNTSVRSIIKSQELSEYRPEDLRSRRFAYNPGWLNMVMPTHLSGMQTGRVEPGKLTVFETGPIMLQNWSVDAKDPAPPSLPGELLAGEQVRNLTAWYEAHGFREIEALRAMEDPEAIQIFTSVHPRLAEAWTKGIIETKCVYDLDVCVTCRADFLSAIEKAVTPNTPFAAAAANLSTSVTTGKSHMRNMWNNWITEMAARHTPGGRGVGELTEDHLHVMRQLHQRTPTDQEFQKVHQTTGALTEALAEQTKVFTELWSGAKRESEEAREREMETLRAENAETRRLMAEQQTQFNEMFAKLQSDSKKK